MEDRIFYHYECLDCGAKVKGFCGSPRELPRVCVKCQKKHIKLVVEEK